MNENYPPKRPEALKPQRTELRLQHSEEPVQFFLNL